MTNLALTMLAVGALAAWSPTVQLAVPEEPIVINLNIKIVQDVRVRLEDDVKELIAREEAGVDTREASGSGADDAAVRRAKAQGVLGEQFDGSLGVRAQSQAEITSLTDRVNTARRDHYARVAAEENVPLDAVRVVAGEERIRAEPPGVFVFDRDRSWRRKQ